MSKAKCSPCELSASLGLAFGVCEVALPKEVDCKSLENQLVKKKITKEKVMKTLYDAATKAGKNMAARDIKEAANFIHVKV